MRLRHHTGRVVHLSHGTGSHPAQDLTELVGQLDSSAGARPDSDPLGVSLWLSPALAAALAIDGRSRTRLRDELASRRLELVTLNGTPPPRGGGEAPASSPVGPSPADASPPGVGLAGATPPGVSPAGVLPAGPSGAAPSGVSAGASSGGGELPAEGAESASPAVAEADWSGKAILEYTLDLARVLVDLLPEDADRGAITTIGIGRRELWDEAHEKAAARVLRQLSAGLAEVAWHHGRAVRVGFRPRPGDVLDDAASVAAAFARLDKDRLGVDLDLGTLGSDPAAHLNRLAGAHVSVVQARIEPGADPSVWRPALAHLMGGPLPGTEHLAADLASLHDAGDLGLALPQDHRIPC
jgi:hypothetical protein